MLETHRVVRTTEDQSAQQAQGAPVPPIGLSTSWPTRPSGSIGEKHSVYTGEPGSLPLATTMASFQSPS